MCYFHHSGSEHETLLLFSFKYSTSHLNMSQIQMPNCSSHGTFSNGSAPTCNLIFCKKQCETTLYARTSVNIRSETRAAQRKTTQLAFQTLQPHLLFIWNPFSTSDFKSLIWYYININYKYIFDKNTYSSICFIYQWKKLLMEANKPFVVAKYVLSYTIYIV